MKKYSIAIVGATGLVGTTLLSILEQRNFPINKIFLLASLSSAGKHIDFIGERYQIEDLETFDFSQVDIAFFCVSNDLSARFAPKAAAAGAIVLDKSYHFRIHPDVPLIVPEVNLTMLDTLPKMRIIANPNCNTVPIAVAIKPIYDAVGIERINVSTYQSVSGTGKEAMSELTTQTQALLNNEAFSPKVYSQQIAFNVLPNIDDLQANGYTREEMKIVLETRKIFNDPTLAINPTAVRVPVFCGHAAAVHIETKEKLDAKDAAELLAKAMGVIVIDNPSPVRDAQGKDSVYVGRIRNDISHKKGLNLWVVADNLRKGAALNSVQIAEHLIKSHL